MPYAEVGGVRLYYEVHGEGVPLLLISGTAWSGEHWKLCQVPFLSRHHRVVSFDHRGTGRSDRPEGPYATRLFAQDAVGILDALGVQEPAHVLGHSMGGRVAQWIALDRPQRVRSLVLAGSGPGQTDPARHYPRGVPIATAESLARQGWEAHFREHLRGRFMFYRAAPELIERFAAVFEGAGGTDLHSYLLHVQARQEHQTADLLPRITQPALVIDGEEDTVVGGGIGHVEGSRYLAEHLPDAEFVLVPAAAHGFLVEQAEASNEAILDFLRRH